MFNARDLTKNRLAFLQGYDTSRYEGIARVLAGIDDKEEDPDEGGDEGGFNFDIEGALRDFARQPVELTVDKFGNVDLQSEAQGMGGGMAGQFLTLNGFMGALPKKRVKEGDTWKGKNDFKMQGLPMQLKINSKNTYTERKEVDGGAAAVIKSKYTVGTAGDDKGDEEGGGMPFQIDAKITGKGTGTTTFGIDANHVLSGTHKIKAKIDAKLENPMSGDEMTIKASLTLEQKLKFSKWVKDDY